MAVKWLRWWWWCLLLAVGLFCVRVNEQTILIDALKDLLSCTCSAAEKTTIGDVVKYFSGRDQQSDSKTAAAAGDAHFTADYKTVRNDPEKTLTSDTCSADENINDVVAATSCRAEAIDAKDAEVAAADAGPTVNDVVKEEPDWRLFIKIHSRFKNMPQRYGCQRVVHISLTALMVTTITQQLHCGAVQLASDQLSKLSDQYFVLSSYSAIRKATKQKNFLLSWDF